MLSEDGISPLICLISILSFSGNVLLWNNLTSVLKWHIGVSQVLKNREIDDYIKIYLCTLEINVTDYIRKIKMDELKASSGGNLGLRRAILKYDDLADNNILYNLAIGVDLYYSNECNEWLLFNSIKNICFGVL